MGSSLFFSDLLTAHEPDRVLRVLLAGSSLAVLSLVLCARWKDWFRRWTSAHFGEARVGFPVGEICLLSELRRASSVRPMKNL
jgi:hypothetical protein